MNCEEVQKYLADFWINASTLSAPRRSKII